jgi:hypothetical protein
MNGPGPDLDGPLDRAWLCLDALAERLWELRRGLESGSYGGPVDDFLLAVLAGHLPAAAASLNADVIAQKAAALRAQRRAAANGG